MPHKPTPCPSWLKVKMTPAETDTIINGIKRVAKTIFESKKLEDALCNLYSRWMDERAYENINDYGNVMKPLVEQHGATFVKATKRPFGFICSIKEVHYAFELTTKGYSYTRLPINVKG
jgi:hypothetical protein